MNHRQNLKDNKFTLYGMVLLEEGNNQNVTSSVSVTHYDDSSVFTIRNEPVMLEAINVLSLLAKTKKAILRAKGDSIPNAVAVANIITEKMLKGNSKIQKISVDSEAIIEVGKILSTIEIVLLKN